VVKRRVRGCKLGCAASASLLPCAVSFVRGASLVHPTPFGQTGQADCPHPPFSPPVCPAAMAACSGASGGRCDAKERSLTELLRRSFGGPPCLARGYGDSLPFRAQSAAWLTSALSP
jgi:hypothetical protein